MEDRAVLARHEAELAAEGRLQMLVTSLQGDCVELVPEVHAELRRLLGGPDRPDRPSEG